MASNKIAVIALREIRPVIWYGDPVFNSSYQLKSILKAELGSAYDELLAKPRINEAELRNKGESHWYSKKFTSNAQPVTTLSKAEQQRLLPTLLAQLEAIEQLAERLQNLPDNSSKQFGEILLYAKEVPSLDYVLIENDAFVLVGWGFTSDAAIVNNFRLKEAIKAILANTNESESIPTQTESTPTPSNATAASPQKWKKYIKPVGLGLLALFILGLLYCLFFHNTKGDLPIDKKVVPVDSTKIIVDSTNNLNSKIVGDRINIIVKKHTNLDAFAKKFKARYPDDVYNIIYIDRKIKQLQLEVPDTARKELSNRLKQEFSEIRLVWSERVFKSFKVPNDEGFRESKKKWAYSRIKAFAAWDRTMGDSAIVVAVIDDGFDLDHPEFKNKVVAPWNVYDHNERVNTRGGKQIHGTHVAGTAVGWAGNEVGVSGIAPNCRLMPLQVGDESGNLYGTAIINAIVYAIDHGADVINLSIGKPIPEKVGKDLSKAEQRELAGQIYQDEMLLWQELFKMAADSNSVIVNAVGNSNVLAALDPMNRSQYSINVAATNQQNQKASFSNYGKAQCDISAPGTDIYSAVPNNQFATAEGTSMAAPMVSGAVALIKSLNPTLTLSEIKDILRRTGLAISSDKNGIGPLIQLDKALAAVPSYDEACSEQIHQLRKRIKDLEDSLRKRDVLIMDTTDKSLTFLMGRWKSTTDIMNSKTKEKIELYFDFKQDAQSTITLVEQDGTHCIGPLDITVQKGILKIDQTAMAKCDPTEKGGYNEYKITCEANARNEAVCTGVPKRGRGNRVEFKLYRVRGN